MSTKAGKQAKKCAKFESQLFRRNLCKNCFKSEAEHKEDYVPPKPPEEKPKNAAKSDEKPKIDEPHGAKNGAKNVPKSEKTSGVKKGAKTSSKEKDEKDKTITEGEIKIKRGHKKEESEDKSKTNKNIFGSKVKGPTGSKPDEIKSPGKSPEQKEERKTIKTSSSDALSGGIGSSKAESSISSSDESTINSTPGSTQNIADSSVIKHKTTDSRSTSSDLCLDEQNSQQGTNVRDTGGEGEGSKTVRSGGGGQAYISLPLEENTTHSNEVSQNCVGEVSRELYTKSANIESPEQTNTASGNIQGSTVYTETGSGSSGEHYGTPSLAASSQSSTRSSSDASSQQIAPSQSLPGTDGASATQTVAILASPPPATAAESPAAAVPTQHLDQSGPRSTSDGVHLPPSAGYTPAVHHGENQQITGSSIPPKTSSLDQQQPLAIGRQTTETDSVLSSSEKQQSRNSAGDLSIQVFSGATEKPSARVEASGTVHDQGLGNQTGQLGAGGDRSYQHQSSVQTPTTPDSPQIIYIQHCDQSGSLATAGSDPDISQNAHSGGATGRTRTRRSRGNSDHLVQDPSTFAIQYPGSDDAAALIIIPSEKNGNRSVTSSLDPYLQETQHVAYHKPVSPGNSQSDITNTTSQQQKPKTLSDDTLRAISGSSLYYYPESDQGKSKGQIIYNSNAGQTTTSGAGDWYYNNNAVPTRSQTDDDNDVNFHSNNAGNKGAYFVRRRRKRPSVDESAWQAARQRRMADTSEVNIARDEAMMEGTRMLIDSLREKVVILEARTEKIDREKNALGDLLSNKKEEFTDMEEDLKFRIEELEDQVNRLSNEKIRLMDRLKLPESERGSIQIQETEINELRKKLEAGDQQFQYLVEENEQLKQECRDFQLEMEEMHDQFREDEALEFREIQKELEATAKNCRILQFKLRKAERRNELIESERIHYEEKIRQLESRFESVDDKQHIREMEEELKMAKEVSVRLHDELEMVEEKRQRYEEELDRMNDILTESENRRHSLQKEVDTLTTEMGKLRDDIRRNNVTGMTKMIGGSSNSKKGPKDNEYDLAQLMRDLSDSLERENDLKEQMKFAEEETRLMRKKLSDLEDENESINLQLDKISSAKSGKFFKKKDAGEKEVVTEREHEMRLEMELAEQEIKVLRRKLDDLGEDNELLIKQIKDIQNLVEGKGKKDADEDDDRPYDEKIRDLAKDIESLKSKLIAKDQEAVDLLRKTTVRGSLKKSRSLEEYREHSPSSMSPVREFQQDLKRQLDFVQQEANILKEKLEYVETENERLTTENRKLEMMSGRTSVPAITADDAVVQNVDLRERVTYLEEENSKLRHQIKLLDERTSRLSKDVHSKSRGDILDESSESRELRDKFHALETECRAMRKKISELESQNSKLTRDLSKHKTDNKKSKDWKKLDKYTTEELKERVWELDGEVKDLLTVIKTRAEETERIEEEIDGYRDDIDKMLDAFKTREKELIEEIDNVYQRNEVLTNLLDLVTERADTTAKQLNKYQELFDSKSSPAKDTDSKGKEISLEKQEKFKSRIEGLEVLLQEEKLKVQAAEKKLSIKDCPLTSITDDNKLKEREKEILQQELTLCQKQLKSAQEQVKSLKERLSKEQRLYETSKDECEKLVKQLEAEKKKNEGGDTKKPASWRWEKQDLEKQIKEQNKKLDDLHEDLKRQQFKWKMAGDDLAKENKLKEKLEKQLQDIRDECESVKTELEETKAKLEQLMKSLEKKEKTWSKERRSLEDDKKAAEQEAKDKADVIKSKDAIIKNKDKLVKDKDKLLKERDEVLAKNEDLVKQKEAELKMKDTSIRHKNDEVKDAKMKCAELEEAMQDKDKRLKGLNEDLRRRDDRLKEKDEILEKINRTLVDKQNEVSDMDKTIRQAMNKLDEREAELKKMKSSADNANKEMKSLEQKVKELKAELEQQKSEFTKKLSVATKAKDKSELELSTLQKEKKALLNDLQDAKEKLKKEQEKWRKEKNKLELDLNQKTEKLRSTDANRGLRQSEVVKNLSTEKEKLITEKHKLSDDINKTKKELKDNTKQWNIEREDLQKIIQEKTKMIEDNQTITERMQQDIEALKKGQSSPSSGLKSIPIPVKHEVSSHRIPVIHQAANDKKIENQLKAKIEEQDILMEADKEGLKDLYEGRIENLSEELSVSHSKVSTLKEENDKQMELLQSSRKALSDLRNRYDQGMNTWAEERERLEKKAKEAETHKKKVSELQKAVDEAKDKLKTEDMKAQELEKRLNTEKKVWAAEKTSLQNKVKQTEESGGTATPGGAPARGGSKVSEFQAKFAKFETSKFGPVKPSLAKASATAGSTGATNTDVDKTVKEAQKAIKDLQALTKDLEKSREVDKKELMGKLEKEKKGWEKERKDLIERTEKLESRSKELNVQDKNIVELQCKLQDERATWLTEKTQLQGTLDQTKELQLKEKAKVTELLAEVKRLKTMTEAIQSRGAEVETAEVKVRGSRRSRTPSEERPTFTKVKVIGSDEPDEVKKALDESLCEVITKALEHISKLAEELQNPVQVVNERKKKSLAPAAFRRSLSTSEVEMAADKESFMYSPQAEVLIMPSYSVPVAAAAPSPTIHASTLDRPSRSRKTNRALGSEADNTESSVIDRRSFRSSSNRNSIYASGTQSAYTSRDSSPEKGKKRSPYPAAPPSMIITPSHTPRRAPSAERDARSFSSRDMARLHEKLSSIETDQEKKEEGKALLKERGRGFRILTKSTSVDHDETPKKLNLSSKKYSRLYQSSSPTRDGYDDAAKSETPMASIRLGSLVITPGVEKYTKAYREEKKKERRSESVSPRSARRKFYDNYYEPKDTDHWTNRLAGKDYDSDFSGTDVDSDARTTDKDDKQKKRRSLSRGKSLDTEMQDAGADSATDTEGDLGRSRRDKYSLRSKAANFIQSVKDKRKMFSKRSSSVDASIRNSIAKTGFQAAGAGAPSSFKPPSPSSDATNTTKEIKETSKDTKDSKRKAFHRRSASIDMTTLFSVSRSSSVKNKDKVNGSSSSSSASTKQPSHSSSSSALAKGEQSSGESGKQSKRSTPSLQASRPGKKSLFDE